MIRSRTLFAVIAVVILAAAPLAAQQTIQGLPPASPRATLTQAVGISTITIDYHRPAVNGRTIWGGLVPYGQVWRAGANVNTTISFSDDAKVEGQAIAAGTYGLHMVPGKEKWTIAFSNVSTAWGSFTYDEEEDALRVEVAAEPSSEFDERLRYSADDVNRTEAQIALHWENLRVPFTVEFDTSELALAKVRRDLRHLPQFSWQGWNSAAAWTVRATYALEQGLEWADRSIGMNENGTNLSTKMAILARLGRTDEVAPIQAKILEVGNEAQINALGYIHLLQLNDVDAALEVFRKNVADYPDSWNAHDSLGEALAAKGENQKAFVLYSKALEMAPENQHARIQGVLDGLKQ
jgi:tetratricopeptide (TPR) repeat protein